MHRTNEVPSRQKFTLPAFFSDSVNIANIKQRNIRFITDHIFSYPEKKIHNFTYANFIHKKIQFFYFALPNVTRLSSQTNKRMQQREEKNRKNEWQKIKWSILHMLWIDRNSLNNEPNSFYLFKLYWSLVFST